MWYGTDDLLYLIDGGCPGKQGFSQQHLSEDTAEAPHIHTFSVPSDKMYTSYSLKHASLTFHRRVFPLEFKRFNVTCFIIEEKSTTRTCGTDPG